MTGLTAQLRLALSVGVVGGFALGCREALLTLEANAFVQPGQYFFLYLTIPILAWMALGALLLLPCGVIVGLVGTLSEGRDALWVYGSVLAFAGGLSVFLPWTTAVTAHLAAVGVAAGPGLRLLLALIGVGLAAGGALVAGAAAAWYAKRAARPLRYVTTLVGVIALVALWPVIHFFTSDWKWGRAVHEAGTSGAELPHVLLISIDTLRADHLGSYGDPDQVTPNLDRLAAEGAAFRHAITSSPWTLPAVASLFTGLYPRHHGAGAITNRRDPLGRSALPDGSWTLARALGERGYRTHAIVTNPYLALRYGFGQGFDSYENVTIESEAFLALAQTTVVRLLHWARPDLIIGDRGDTVSARAVRWLDRVDTRRPFFLWVHYVDPHPPYSRPGATRHKSFRTDSLLAPPALNGGELTVTSPDVARLRSGEIRLSAAQKAAVQALYRAEVAQVDSAVGTVLEALDRRGLRERTLVVCVADHGEEFWEHGGVEHGHTVYDELLRVPLMMRWPGRVPAGTWVDPVVRITDVAPTILDLLALPVPVQRDGATLMPLIRGDESLPRVALSENMLFAEERVGLRTQAYKYVRWETGKEEVYDLTADPGERVDLAGVSATLAPLRQLHAALAQDSTVVTGTRDAPQLDEGAAQALRALGYLR